MAAESSVVALTISSRVVGTRRWMGMTLNRACMESGFLMNSSLILATAAAGSRAVLAMMMPQMPILSTIGASSPTALRSIHSSLPALPSLILSVVARMLNSLGTGFTAGWVTQRHAEKRIPRGHFRTYATIDNRKFPTNVTF